MTTKIIIKVYSIANSETSYMSTQTKIEISFSKNTTLDFSTAPLKEKKVQMYV